MEEQLQHQNSKFTPSKFPIVLVCDRVHSPANIGSIFRIADSYGVEKIYFCGEDITIISKRMQRTARATHQFVPYEQEDDIEVVLDSLVKQGYELLALEITKQSIPLPTYNVEPTTKMALILGEENTGVDAKILDQVSQTLHIPMYGTNTSMNVATATGIALYELTKQLIPTL